LKRRRNFVPLFLVILSVLTMANAIAMVSANIPRVAQIENISQDSSGRIRLQIVHLAPSPTHYVNVIEVTINMTTKQFNQTAQDSNPFTVELDLGPLQGTVTVMARAHCTLHGWGDWSSTILIQQNHSTSTSTGQPQILLVIGAVAIVVVLASIVIIRRIRNR
jgi:desulfoferrodoxin (superoxide reductase-like protein)